jgi:DNA modification methylase
MTPAPVYATDLVELYQADARDVLSHLPTESVDIVITDPPYGVDWESNLRAERFGTLLGDGSDDDSRAIIHGVITQTVRLVGQHRHLYIFGPTDVLDGQKVSRAVELVWDKGRAGAGDLNLPWGPGHELITVAVSHHRHAGKAGSVLRVPARTGLAVRHPSEKPTALLTELLESSSRQGETVLDPFAGVGSTGVAAILSGRRAVLVEKDPQYVPTAIDRLRRAEAIAKEARTV